jgi:hypothetical protein
MDSRSSDDESDAEDGHGERGASRMDGTVSADEEEERIVFDQDEGAATASAAAAAGAGSSAAADPEAAAQAPPPTALSDADKEELIAKLEEMRKARSNQRFELHGWSCAWKSRPGQHTAFDMTCIEDATGAKCFSVRAPPSSRAHDAAAPCENPRREELTTRSPPPWSTPQMLAVKRRLGLIPDPDVPPPPSAASTGEPAASSSAAAAASGKGGSSFDLTEEQQEEILQKVEEIRKRPRSTDEYLHGWRLIYTLRTAGSAARGDLTAVDPRDGKKIYSLVSLRRRFAGEEDPWVLDDSAGKKRKLDGPGNLRNLDGGRERRARATVNYAEVDASSIAPRLTDIVLSALDDEVKARKGLPEAAWAGLDYLTLAELVHKRAKRVRGSEHVPLGPVRGALTSLLRQGKLRRRLAAADDERHLVNDGSVAYHLRRLVLNTLQVEPDEGAPWTLTPWADDMHAGTSAATGVREHVWKGVTSSRLPSLQGAALVGRTVCIWWGGNGAFLPARVTAYNATKSAVGDVDGAPGSHVLVYGFGLRAIECLEGPGEPQLWRLASEAEAAALQHELDGAGVVTDEPPPPEGSLFCARRPNEDEDEEGAREDEEGAQSEDDEGDEDGELPPVRVTLRCHGCVPVGSRGTAAYAARRAARRRAKAGEAALLAKSLEVYWPHDRCWYACEVLDFVEADGTYLIEYNLDGVQEYIDLQQHGWRYKDPKLRLAAARLAAPDSQLSEPADRLLPAKPSTAAAAVAAVAAGSVEATRDDADAEDAIAVNCASTIDGASHVPQEEAGEEDKAEVTKCEAAPAVEAASPRKWGAAGEEVKVAFGADGAEVAAPPAAQPPAYSSAQAMHAKLRAQQQGAQGGSSGVGSGAAAASGPAAKADKEDAGMEDPPAGPLGTILWAKQAGYVYWPAIVALEAKGPDRHKREGGWTFVRYFGTKQFGYCKLTMPWAEGKEKCLKEAEEAQKKKPASVRGFKQGVEEAEAQIANPSQEAEVDDVLLTAMEVDEASADATAAAGERLGKRPEQAVLERYADDDESGSDASAENAGPTLHDSAEQSAATDPETVPARDWRAEGPRVETAMSLNQIKAALPLADKEVSEFKPVAGWAQHSGEGGPRRKVAPKWIRLTPAHGRTAAVQDREALESLLEREAREAGRPWLGQMSMEGQWEIRRRAVDEAIDAILGDLVAAGLVCAFPGDAAGKGAGTLYCAANRYVRGEPFPIDRRRQDEKEKEPEEELCDFELERKRNIERNKALLRELGLL